MSELLGIEEACKLLDLTKHTIYKYARSGDLPACKMGNLWKFHRQSLENWILSRVEKDTQERIAKKQLMNKKKSY